MKLNVRVVAAAVALLGVAAMVLPASVGAQKVQNPGVFALQATGGQMVIGGLGLDLTPNPLPQCSDGIDNDGNGYIDLGDGNCGAGPNGEPASSDDSEAAWGFQPKVNVSITGSIDGAGAITIPTSGIVFPPAYVVINLNGRWVVRADVLATEPATGTLDPLTGAAVLNVKARVKLSGNIGNQLASACSIGTTASPISLNLITGRKEAIPGGNGAINGAPYNSVTGTALLVDNAFYVPGATGCTAGVWNVNSTINSQVGIPSAVGRNAAVVAGKTNPVLTKAITPVITSSAPLSGNAAPFAVTLSGASSTFAKGPATYSWEFADGTTATGQYVDKTFAEGSQWAKLTVTDGDGDKNSVQSNFVVNPGVPVPITPRITTDPTTPDGQAPRTVTFSGATSTVLTGPASYAWSFSDGTTATGVETTKTFTVPGSQTATLTVTDGTGATASVNRTFTISEVPPPPTLTPRITTNPTTPGGQAPRTVEFSAATSTVTGPATYSWAFSDGTTATGATTSKTFTTPGEKTATLTITDAASQTASVSTSFTITEAPLPTLTPRITTNPTTPGGPAPRTVTFSAATSTVTGPATYSWAFDDGTTATGSSTSKTFTTPGEKTATLTITDAASQTASVSTSFTITDEPPPPTDDTVGVRITGAVNYTNEGGGTGGVTVVRDSNGIASVTGTMDIPGAQGGTAQVTTNIKRAWILPLWTGQVSVRDVGAGVNVAAPVFGQISRGDTANSAKGTSNWFIAGKFPNLFRPYSLSWSVVDAG